MDNPTPLEPAETAQGYISAGFTYRSKDYPAGVPVDHIEASDLSQLIRSGLAVQAKALTHPAQDSAATTEE